jgi:hypothetical protein
MSIEKRASAHDARSFSLRRVNERYLSSFGAGRRMGNDGDHKNCVNVNVHAFREV